MKKLLCRLVYGKPIKGINLPKPMPFPEREVKCMDFNQWAIDYNVSLKFNIYECIETVNKLKPIKFILSQY
jgi:hypothetical protein